MVYLIVNEVENVCKIGYSENPSARVATLQTGCPFPLKLLKVIDGGLIQEGLLHKKFKEYQLQGEWFQYVKEIREHFDVVSDRHVSLYLENIEVLARCRGAEQAVVLSVLQYLNWATNEFILTPERRAAICECGGIKPDTVSASISRLVKKNIIIKKSGSTYILNPKIFFYGRDIDRASVVEATMVYVIGGGKTKPNPLGKSRSFIMDEKKMEANSLVEAE